MSLHLEPPNCPKIKLALWLRDSAPEVLEVVSEQPPNFEGLIPTRLENESASGLGNLELVIGFLLERLADSKYAYCGLTEALAGTGIRTAEGKGEETMERC